MSSGDHGILRPSSDIEAFIDRRTGSDHTDTNIKDTEEQHAESSNTATQPSFRAVSSRGQKFLFLEQELPPSLERLDQRSDGKYYCSLGQCRGSRDADPMRHARTHYKPVLCPERETLNCYTQKSTQRDMKRHVVKSHPTWARERGLPAAREFPCSDCNSRFTREDNLTKHRGKYHHRNGEGQGKGRRRWSPRRR